jgi:hypothetical protein
LDEFPAINCLATIIQSLRDKFRQARSGQQTVGTGDNIDSIFVFEHEHEDEHEHERLLTYQPTDERKIVPGRKIRERTDT